MSIKLIHTSDWHLGKTLLRKGRLDEQKLFLDWLYSVIKEKKIDGLIIAGDVFDSPTPKASALKLYFDFLFKIAQIDCQAFIIAGNHDSGVFLEAPNTFLGKEKIHVVGSLHSDINRHIFTIKREGESVSLFLIPFFRILDLMKWGNVTILSDNLESDIVAILKTKIDEFFKKCLNSRVGVTIATLHHLFGNATCLGSEHLVSLSGVESIPINIFSEFNYTALGHIHGEQTLRSQPVVKYAGSPIQFKFNERIKKTITMIDIKEGDLTAKSIEIPQFRSLYSLKVTDETMEDRLAELISMSRSVKGINYELDDFLEVILNSTYPQTGVVDIIRNIILEYKIELISFISMVSKEEESEKNGNIDVDGMNIVDLFKLFLKEKFLEEETGPPSHILNEFKNLYDHISDSDKNDNK